MSYAALASASYAPAGAAALPPRPALRAAPAARPAGYGAGAGYGGAGASSAARYRDAELASATPGQLVVMLFDKCLLTVRRAEAAFAAGDVAQRVDQVCRAADMVTELRASLDREAGGAIAAQLDALYAFVLGELWEANRRRDAARLGPVLGVLGGLREGFAGAQAQLAAAAAAAPNGLPNGLPDAMPSTPARPAAGVPAARVA